MFPWGKFVCFLIIHWIHHTRPKIGLYKKAATKKKNAGRMLLTISCGGFWQARPLGRDWLSQGLNQSSLSDQQFPERNAGLSHSYWGHVLSPFPYRHRVTLQPLSVPFAHSNSAFSPLAWLQTPGMGPFHPSGLPSFRCYPHIRGQVRINELDEFGFSLAYSSGPRTDKFLWAFLLWYSGFLGPNWKLFPMFHFGSQV